MYLIFFFYKSCGFLNDVTSLGQIRYNAYIS
jgi:hypothetical protein